MGKNLDQYIDFVHKLHNMEMHGGYPAFSPEDGSYQYNELNYDDYNADGELLIYKDYLRNKAIKEKMLDYIDDPEDDGGKAGFIGGLTGALLGGGAGFALDRAVDAPFIMTGLGATLGGLGGYAATRGLYQHTSLLDKYKKARRKATEEVDRLTPKNKEYDRLREMAVQKYSDENTINKKASSKSKKNKLNPENKNLLDEFLDATPRELNDNLGFSELSPYYQDYCENLNEDGSFDNNIGTHNKLLIDLSKKYIDDQVYKQELRNKKSYGKLALLCSAIGMAGGALKGAILGSESRNNEDMLYGAAGGAIVGGALGTLLGLGADTYNEYTLAGTTESWKNTNSKADSKEDYINTIIKNEDDLQKYTDITNPKLKSSPNLEKNINDSINQDEISWKDVLANQIFVTPSLLKVDQLKDRENNTIYNVLNDIKLPNTRKYSEDNLKNLYLDNKFKQEIYGK